ncbi:MAG: hypothetical protein ACTSWZ_05225 [Candidatus Heimdallarchaeaceae archaeon]
MLLPFFKTREKRRKALALAELKRKERIKREEAIRKAEAEKRRIEAERMRKYKEAMKKYEEEKRKIEELNRKIRETKIRPAKWRIYGGYRTGYFVQTELTEEQVRKYFPDLRNKNLYVSRDDSLFRYVEISSGSPIRVVKIAPTMTKEEFLRKHPEYKDAILKGGKVEEVKPEKRLEELVETKGGVYGKKKVKPPSEWQKRVVAIEEAWEEARKKGFKTGYVYDIKEVEKGKFKVVERYDPYEYAIRRLSQEMAFTKYGKEYQFLSKKEKKEIRERAIETVRKQVQIEKEGGWLPSQLGAEMRLEDFFGLGTIAGTIGTMAVHGIEEGKKIAYAGQFLERTKYRQLAETKEGRMRLYAEAGALGGLEAAFTFGVPAITSAGISSLSTSAVGTAVLRAGRLGIWGGLAGFGVYETVKGYEGTKFGSYEQAKRMGYGMLLGAIAIPKLYGALKTEFIRFSPSYRPVEKDIVELEPSKKLKLKETWSEKVTPEIEKKLIGKRKTITHVSQKAMEFEYDPLRKMWISRIKRIEKGAGAGRRYFGEFGLYGAPPELKTGIPQSYLAYAGKIPSGEKARTLSFLEYLYLKAKGYPVRIGTGEGTILYTPSQIGKVPKKLLTGKGFKTRAEWEMAYAKWLMEEAPKGFWYPAAETVTGRSAEYQVVLPPESTLAKTGKVWKTIYKETPFTIIETKTLVGKEVSKTTKTTERLVSKRYGALSYDPSAFKRFLYTLSVKEPTYVKYEFGERVTRELEREARRITERKPTRVQRKIRREKERMISLEREMIRLPERPRFDFRITERPIKRIPEIIRPSIKIRESLRKSFRLPSQLFALPSLLGKPKAKTKKKKKYKRKYKYVPSLTAILPKVKPIKKPITEKMFGLEIRPFVKKKKIEF